MSKEAKVSGPSQLNVEPDPKFERVKREIKADILMKDNPGMKKALEKARRIQKERGGWSTEE